MSDGTIILSAGQKHVRIPKRLVDDVRELLREAHQEGQRDARSQVRTALGIDDVVETLEFNMAHAPVS